MRQRTQGVEVISVVVRWVSGFRLGTIVGVKELKTLESPV